MRENAGWWMVGGGAAVATGSFMPWVSVKSIFGTLSVSGMDGDPFGDGIFTLLAGAVLGIIGGVVASGRPVRTVHKVLGWLALLGTGWVWALDFSEVSDRVDLVRESDLAQATVGSGLWVIAVGAVVAVVGVLNLKEAREPQQLPPPEEAG